MSTQDTLKGQQKFWLPVDTQAIRRRLPLPVRLALLIFLAMTILVLFTVMIAHAQSSAQLPDLDLPQAYLPGSPMPEDVLCSPIPDGTSEGCYVNYRDNHVFLKLDVDARTIVRAAFSTQGYTIGELIAAWGTPTGIIRTYYMTALHWGPRAAYVYADSFRPDSPVRLIQYNPNPQRTIPWRGFRRYRNNPPTG